MPYFAALQLPLGPREGGTPHPTALPTLQANRDFRESFHSLVKVDCSKQAKRAAARPCPLELTPTLQAQISGPVQPSTPKSPGQHSASQVAFSPPPAGGGWAEAELEQHPGQPPADPERPFQGGALPPGPLLPLPPRTGHRGAGQRRRQEEY